MTSTPTRSRGEVAEGRTGLSTKADGRAVPNAWQRARRRVDLEDPFVSWTSAIALTLVSLFLRLWHLGQPKLFEFDEVYYAKDAWSLAHFGYVRNYVGTADEQILNGHTDHIWQTSPSMIVHPEVGKWLIAAGEATFGMNPLGWRISAAIVGSLMVLVMCRLGRRLTGSTLLGLVAGLLLSLDGMQFVLSRLGLLDIFLGFFLLCAVTCLVVDRDWYRERMARRVRGPITGSGWGPVRSLLFRPWLLLSGVCWGLACGTKWDAVYPLAAFGVMVWLWSAGARRSFGVRWPLVKSVLADGVPAFVHLVLVGLVVYVATWTGWLIHAHEYEKNLSSTQYTQYVAEGHCDGETPVNKEDPTKKWPTADEPDAHGLGEVWQSLRSLWYYHHDVYIFHTHFLNCATHTYASKPSGWLLINRPVGAAADTGIKPGDRGCQAPVGSTCLRQVLIIGNPTIWWGGCIALLFAVAMWVGARDWRYGFAVVGVASTWLPWLQYDRRPIFIFYAIAVLPFIVVALTLAIGTLIGPSRQPGIRRTVGVVVGGSFVVLALLNFAWFWPIWTDGLLTHREWLDRIWFSRWI